MAAGLGRHRKACARTRVSKGHSDSRKKNSNDNNDKAEIGKVLSLPKDACVSKGVHKTNCLGTSQEAASRGSKKSRNAKSEFTSSKKTSAGSSKKNSIDQKKVSWDGTVRSLLWLSRHS